MIQNHTPRSTVSPHEQDMSSTDEPTIVRQYQHGTTFFCDEIKKLIPRAIQKKNENHWVHGVFIKYYAGGFTRSFLLKKRPNLSQNVAFYLVDDFYLTKDGTFVKDRHPVELEALSYTELGRIYEALKKYLRN